MTLREQKIETVLREFFKSTGWKIWQDGDIFAGFWSIAALAEGGDGPKDINVSELARDIERVL